METYFHIIYHDIGIILSYHPTLFKHTDYSINSMSLYSCLWHFFSLRNGQSLGTAFSNIKMGPGIAYFPAISLSFKESVAFNFGSRPLRYPFRFFLSVVWCCYCYVIILSKGFYPQLFISVPDWILPDVNATMGEM